MADQIITFDEIPADWRVPGSYAEIKPRYNGRGIAAWPTKILLLCQKLPGGAAVPGRAYRVTRVEQAVGLFGLGSSGVDMATAAIAANPTSELWMASVSDPTGAKASGGFALTAAATAAGTLAVGIAGRRFAVPVAQGDTAATVATALAAAISARTDLPVTAAAAAGTVTLTAKHAGTIGNSIDLRLNPLADDARPAGLFCTVNPMTGGTGEADISGVISSLANDWFTDLAIAWEDSAILAALATELDRRARAQTRLDMYAYYGARGDFATLTTKGSGLNSRLRSMMGAKNAGSPPWAWAASLCAVAALQRAADPARQLRGLALPGIVGPAPADRFIDTERDLLLRDGVSTFTVAADGTVCIERLITEYQTTALGVADTAWLDAMVPWTMARIRYDWTSYISLLFPRAKLVADDSPAAELSDTSVVTCRRLHGEWAARCREYERLGWIEDAKRTAEESAFVRNAADRNRVDARLLVRIVGNLMVLAQSLEFEA